MPRQKWECEFCSLTHYHEAEAIEHEKRCKLNPAVRGCHTCGHREEFQSYTNPDDLMHSCAAGRHTAPSMEVLCPCVSNCYLWIPEEDDDA